jgi:hypothetical protein
MVHTCVRIESPIVNNNNNNNNNYGVGIAMAYGLDRCPVNRRLDGRFIKQKNLVLQPGIEPLPSSP